MHSGKIIAIVGQNLTMSHDDGTGQGTHAVDPKAAVTLNGRPVQLSDLRNGDEVEIFGDPVASVAAVR